MDYATLIQLTERYAERDLRNITDDDAQALDTVRAGQAIADASAEIEGYLFHALPAAVAGSVRCADGRADDSGALCL